MQSRKQKKKSSLKKNTEKCLWWWDNDQNWRPFFFYLFAKTFRANENKLNICASQKDNWRFFFVRSAVRLLRKYLIILITFTKVDSKIHFSHRFLSSTFPISVAFLISMRFDETEINVQSENSGKSNTNKWTECDELAVHRFVVAITLRLVRSFRQQRFIAIFFCFASFVAAPVCIACLCLHFVCVFDFSVADSSLFWIEKLVSLLAEEWHSFDVSNTWDVFCLLLFLSLSRAVEVEMICRWHCFAFITSPFVNFFAVACPFFVLCTASNDVCCVHRGPFRMRMRRENNDKKTKRRKYFLKWNYLCWSTSLTPQSSHWRVRVMFERISNV